jgi:hypothetical protein
MSLSPEGYKTLNKLANVCPINARLNKVDAMY